jgi:hypothetical protein
LISQSSLIYARSSKGARGYAIDDMQATPGKRFIKLAGMVGCSSIFGILFCISRKGGWWSMIEQSAMTLVTSAAWEVRYHVLNKYKVNAISGPLFPGGWSASQEPCGRQKQYHDNRKPCPVALPGKDQFTRSASELVVILFAKGDQCDETSIP